MFKQCLRAENAKIKSPIVWILFFLLPIFPAVLGTCNFLSNQSILHDGWYSLWTQHTIFYADFFYAPLVALYASYFWRMEHSNHNWNFIMTAPVHLGHLFLAKFAVLFRMTILIQFWIGFLFFISGKLIHLPGMMPPEFLLWLFRGCIGSIGIIALSLLISMRIRSFAIPIVIALAGSILSLGMVSNGDGYAWPYALMMLGMNANASNNVLGENYVLFFGAAIFFFLIFTGHAILYLKKRDVYST